MRSRPLLVWLWVLFMACNALATPSKTLKFWAVTGNLQDVDMFQKLARDFERKTGIKVEVTDLAWGNFKEKYFVSMAAGLPPDIGVTNLGGPFDYGTVGGLVDFRSEFPADCKRLEAQFDPKLLTSLTVDGKLYGVPSDLSTLICYYRTDTFKQLGLSPPKTWSEMSEMIAKLEGAGYQFYFGFTAGNQWALGLYTMPYGLPGVHPGQGGKPVVDWNDPKYQEGVFEALSLWNMHVSPGKDLGGRAVGMFASDEKETSVPFMLDLPAVAAQIHTTRPELDGKWAMAPWPRADDGKPFNVMGGTSYVIFRNSQMKREAMQWLLYLNSLEAQQQMILDHLNRGKDSNFFVSAVKPVWDPGSEAFWNSQDLKSSRDLYEVLHQVVPTFDTVAGVHGIAEAGRLEGNLLDSIGTYIHDQLQARADKAGLSRSELIRNWGRGKMLDVKREMDADLRSKITSEYAKVTPQALTVVTEETAKYQEKYGKVIANLDAAQKAGDALQIANLFAVLLFVAGLTAVVGVKGLRKHFTSYAYVALPLTLALVFVFVPALVALYLSFTEYHPVLPLSTAHWTGTSNYSDIVHSGDLFSSLKRTFYYTIMSLPIGIVIALGLAYMLNSNVRGKRLWRFLYFSPLVTSVVSIALIFSQLFLGASQGWLNAMLLKAHLIKDPIEFLNSERTFLNCVIVLAIWHGLAFTILVFLAGFQQVPNELYESASIDGASPVRRFWNIAVPGIRPQVFFISVLGLIGSFQVFETIYMLANKSGNADAKFGANDSALTVVPLLYHYGFETFEMGKAAAVAYVLFVIILIITAVQLKIYRRREA